jgi:hypothetical protein
MEASDEEYTELTSLMINLKNEKGLAVIKTKDNGNSLFSAVAHQVYGSRSKHPLVREECVAYMKEHTEFFCNYLLHHPDSGTIEVRIKFMKRDQ